MDGSISIGRNVGTQPMDDSQWGSFVADIEDLVRKHGGEVHTVAYGNGAWDGVPEESAVIVFAGAAEGFDQELSALASWYDQDAIALVSGVSSLVYRAD
jgi:hypothetical protein